MSELVREADWNPRQKDEGRHVKAALEKIEAVPYSELYTVDVDPPDFVVFTQNAQIAVEHTRLYYGSELKPRPLRADEVEREKLTAIAKDQYRLSENDPVYVRIVWRNGKSPLLRNRNCDGKLLSRIVEKSLAAQKNRGKTQYLIESHLERDTEWPNSVSNLFVTRLPARLSESIWTADFGFWEARLDPLHVQKVIDGKSAKAGKFIGSYTQAWLIMVVEQTSQSASVDIGRIAADPFYSAFDRTFIWGHSLRTLYELQTSRRRVT